jgi:uncharacterized protein (TIGR00369 family)
MKKEYISLLQSNIGKNMGSKLPGFGGWLNAKIRSINESGDVQLDFEVREDMLNPMGNIHGGAMAGIIDEILGFQLFLKSAEEAAYVSMTMNIDFLRPASLGDTITAVPSVVRIGKKTANVSCQLLNSEGKVLANAASNFIRVR